MSATPNHGFPLEHETKTLIGIAFEIHRILGTGFLEIVYKDAFEYELHQRGIPFSRENEYKIKYKDIFLKHRFHADFVVFDKVILEVKSQNGIAEKNVAQTLNYLKTSGCKVGLILNFGETSLQVKRYVL
ncbi:GxxExxY protein [Sediminibacterium roseum]|uniref:GxxExxY protein n=2 Tax=Sediminibacterium roseum TaxID=1978412 RepID=A0ABW9ZZA5_9BACT|nr:GxxExxY protein [Sediminibacterium roseum]